MQDADACDLYKAGMLPVQSSSCGGGSCCVTGEKWLGVRPTLKSHLENVKVGKEECWKFAKMREETLQKGLSLGEDVAKIFAKGA
jgi:hypothetical protein